MRKSNGVFVFLFLFGFASTTKIPSNVLEMNEKFLEVKNKGLWFIEFYAPWCAYCKKLMPVWEHVGHALADKNSPVRVGKVDCTRFSSVASALGIRGYPTIIFFRNGVQIHYEGERTKEDIIKFAEKCAGPVVDTIKTQTQFAELRKHADREPFFVFSDPAHRSEEEGSDERALLRAYENASDLLFTETHFYEVKQQHILPQNIQKGNETTVYIFKDKDYWFEYSSDVTEAMFEWIQHQRWPLLPLVTASNLHTISEATGKKMVLIPVDSIDRLNTSTASGRFFDIVKRAAIQVRDDPQLVTKYQFGWVEGNHIVNGIVMGTLTVPNLVVFNMSSYEFYVSDDRPDQMTAHSLLLFLRNVQQGDVPAQGGRAWITRLRRMYYDVTTNVYDMFQHQPILTVCLFGVPLAFFSIIAYSICSTDFSVDRDEVYPDEDEDVDDDAKDDDDVRSYEMLQSDAMDADVVPLDYDHEKAE